MIVWWSISVPKRCANEHTSKAPKQGLASKKWDPHEVVTRSRHLVTSSPRHLVTSSPALRPPLELEHFEHFHFRQFHLAKARSFPGFPAITRSEKLWRVHGKFPPPHKHISYDNSYIYDDWLILSISSSEFCHREGHAEVVFHAQVASAQLQLQLQ